MPRSMSRARRATVAVAVTGILVGLLACGGSKSPSEVVAEFYGLVSSGKFDAASKHLSADAKLMFGSTIGMAESWGQFVSDEFGSAAVRRVEVLSETMRGNEAEVCYILHSSDGVTELLVTDVLVKEGGRWKIKFS